MAAHMLVLTETQSRLTLLPCLQLCCRGTNAKLSPPQHSSEMRGAGSAEEPQQWGQQLQHLGGRGEENNRSWCEDAMFSVFKGVGGVTLAVRMTSVSW